MEKIKFTIDSTCDLSKELIEELNVDVINFFVNLGEKTYRDGLNITPQMIFDYVSETDILPKTAAPSPEDYIKLFSKYNKEYDYIMHFNISSNLSAANQCAIVASQNFDNVIIIDSLSLSTGTSLLLLKANELMQQGKGAKEIETELNKLKYNVQASFIIETLEYLYKGGRCSGLARLGATILKLHPMLLLKKGNITVHKKIRGKIKDVYVDYLKTLKKEFPEPENSYAFITYTSIDEDIVKLVKSKIEEIYNFKKIYLTNAGSTVTSHCGEGTLGLLFINSKNIN